MQIPRIATVRQPEVPIGLPRTVVSHTVIYVNERVVTTRFAFNNSASFRGKSPSVETPGTTTLDLLGLHRRC